MELSELSEDPTIIRSNESVPLMGEEVISLICYVYSQLRQGLKEQNDK